jgi:hypothetical protein
MQIGVCCCVSYTSTESWVATAYTMRYGSAKAGFGPVPDTAVSRLRGAVLVVGVGVSTETGGGGGSITEGAGDGLESGSGNAGMGSSADDVSMVMFFVTGGDVLRV